MPKVSIIVPIYNVEAYIEKCLTTLVNQTLEDIQIILVNDGSKDGSIHIAKQFKENYPDKILYLEKENGGLSDARNFGIPYATGEYIAFLDSDDYIELDMYECLYHKAKQENSDLVECDFFWEYPDKTIIDVGEHYIGKQDMLEKIRVVAWNKLIKRELLQQTGILFPKGLRYEDVEFSYMLLPYLNTVSFVKKPFIHYIQRGNSISNVQNEKTKDIFEVLDHVIEFYKKHGFYEEYETQLEFIYTRYLLCSSLRRMVKVQDKQTRKKLLKQTWDLLNTKFPNWKANCILKQKKDGKSRYMKSVNKVTYPIYCKIFRGV